MPFNRSQNTNTLIFVRINPGRFLNKITVPLELFIFVFICRIFLFVFDLLSVDYLNAADFWRTEMPAIAALPGRAFESKVFKSESFSLKTPSSNLVM